MISLVIWTNPGLQSIQSRTIYDRQHRLISVSHPDFGFQLWVPLTEVPPSVQTAIVVAEDKRFWQHPGVDPLAIVRATLTNLRYRRLVSGASTIHQQVARFVVMKRYAPSRVSLARKIRESLIALRLNLALSKHQVLEIYLNSMYFGHDVYGINTAAMRYFNRPITTLSPAEYSLLIGMIANPTAYDPVTHPTEAKQRRDLILDRLKTGQLLTDEEYQRSLAEPLPDIIYPVTVKAPHFVDMVNHELDQLFPRQQQPLIIETTLDLDWFEASQQIINRQIASLGEVHGFHNAASIIIDNHTATVLSLVGNADYFDGDHGGQINMATALRQPGSALKPFTYEAALDLKLITPASVIDDTPRPFMTKKGTAFIPNNYDGRYRGPVLAREALASSYNLPAVDVLSRVSIPTFLDYTHRFGITTLTDIDRYDYALTLGGGEVTLVELANAYATLARQGQWQPLAFITSVTTVGGQRVYTAPVSLPKPVVPAESAYLVTSILKDPKARLPTFGAKSPLNTTMETAVKTGTTTDWHDNWTIGYNPEFTVGVWIGNADRTAMRDISGVTGAGPVWHDTFEKLCQNHACTKFVPPPGLTEKTVCAWDGLLPGPDCTETYTEIFLSGTEPSQVSSLTQRPAAVADAAPAIISPKAGAKFDMSYNRSPKILFEISHTEQAAHLTWILDGQVIATNQSFAWSPIVGQHRLQAEITTPTGNQISLVPVDFYVSD